MHPALQHFIRAELPGYAFLLALVIAGFLSCWFVLNPSAERLWDDDYHTGTSSGVCESVRMRVRATPAHPSSRYMRRDAPPHSDCGGTRQHSERLVCAAVWACPLS